MSFDVYQRAVIDMPPGANIKVIGSPGSGKTRCLVGRYARLVMQHDIDPDRILALTFSRKAANEMSKRICDNVSISGKAKSNISTINAFCHRLYNEWRKSIGNAPLKVWEHGDNVTNPDFIASDLMNKHLNMADMSMFDAINSTLKSVPNPGPRRLSDKLGYDATTANNSFNMWKEYEIWMKDNNLVDFPGQVWNIDRLLHSNKVFAMMTGRSFDKIIADEVQDMFPQTYRILLKLAEHSSIELFGDPSQSIYGFNGAAPKLMVTVDDLLPDIKTLHLSNNYRSGSNIVELVNDFGPQTIEAFKPMSVVNDFNGCVEKHGAEYIDDQADYIADRIKGKKFDYNDVFVLARTNAQCATICHRLIELGVPAYHASDYSIWDKAHMKAGIGYVALSTDQDKPDDLLNVINIPSVDFVNVFGGSRGNYAPTRYLPKKLFQGISFKDISELNITRGQKPGVSNLTKFINALKQSKTNRDRVGNIQDAISKWARWSGQDYMGVENNLSMLWDKLENLDYNVDRLRIYISKIKEDKRKIKKNSNKVQVMTIHQSKGLEAPVVFLTGLSQPIDNDQYTKKGFHPGRNTNVDINEENCLYYVGISRAIRHLYLTFYTISGDEYYALSSFVNSQAIKLIKGDSNDHL